MRHASLPELAPSQGFAVGALPILIAASLLTASCGDGSEPTPPAPPDPPSNQAPAAVGSILDVEVVEGEEVVTNVAANFSDPDGDALSYAASSSSVGVATAAAAGSQITVTGVAPGEATITVTATDPGGLSATQSYTATVTAANRAPVTTVTSVEEQTQMVGDTVSGIDLSPFFMDPDGDTLTYAAGSADTAIATVAVEGALMTVVARAEGTTTVTVTATDPGQLSASLEIPLRVTAANRAPVVADTIPTHDLLVDSMVALDMAPYFMDPAGGALSFAAETSDGAVAAAMVDGNAVVTRGVGAPEDSVATALLAVTAMNEEGGSATQDSIVVRVHREPYDTLPGVTLQEDGTVTALVPVIGPRNLTICVQSDLTGLAGLTPIIWSEWQRATGGGWITVQDNNRISTATGEGGSICPIALADDAFPPGRYRLVGLVGVGGDPPRHYRTNTIEKKPEG